MKRISLYFMIASLSTSLFGASSITLGPNDTSTVTVPNSPYNALTSYRFEGRISSWSTPANGNFFLQSVAGSIAIDSSNNLHCFSNADSTTKGQLSPYPVIPTFCFVASVMYRTPG